MMNNKEIYNKAIQFLPFAALIVYLLVNAGLLIWVFVDPMISNKVVWLAIAFTLGISVYCWKQATGQWPENGMLVLGFVAVSITLAYGILVLLPNLGLSSRLFKIFLVVFCGLIILPVSYYIGRNFHSKHYEIPTILLINDISVQPNTRLYLLWGAITILIFSYFVIPVYLRSDVIGWDTPAYIFRARLLDFYGIEKHTQIGGGYQITFPMLSVALHRLTGLDYMNVVKLLSAFLMTLICLTSGYFAFLVIRSQPFAILSTLFTASWSFSPHMVSNLRDNLTVTLFGMMALICLAKSHGKNALLFDLLQIIFLILTGVSHLTLSFIFFGIIALVNLMEFFDSYRDGERKNIFHGIFKALRVPAVSGIAVIFIWYPVFQEFLFSLGFGLRTVAEAEEVRNNTFAYITDRYFLTPSLPWILLGLLWTTWVVNSIKHQRAFKIVYVWSLICLIWGIVLQPISYLNDRFLIMAPIYLLIAIGVYFFVNMGNYLTWINKITFSSGLVIIILGMLLPSYLISNSMKLGTEIQGVPASLFSRLGIVNHYLESNHIDQPVVYLVESVSVNAEAYSTLWLRIFQSSVPEKSFLQTYIYFGTLEYLLRGEPTPINASGLPLLKAEGPFSKTSQRWFDVLEEDDVFDNGEITVIIIETYNAEIFDQYEFLPVVDKIGPGILVVNLPNDLVYLNVTNRSNP